MDPTMNVDAVPVAAVPAPVPADDDDVAVVGTVVPTEPIRPPVAELAIKAGAVAVEGALGFVRAVDQGTDAVLDLFTQVLPGAASNAASSVSSKSAAISSTVRRFCRRSAYKYRKNKFRLSNSSDPYFTTEVASFVVTCIVVGVPALVKVLGYGFQQARSFFGGIPDIVRLAYAGGLIAGILQMLMLHAASLVWQMSHSPTADWVQMTAVEKVQDVGAYVVEVAPYLPETVQGMTMLTVASVSYAALFFYWMSPNAVQFEFNVEPEKEFFTVTAPGLAKSAAAAVRSFFSVPETVQSQPAPSDTVPSPPASPPTKSPEGVPNGTSSEPSSETTAAMLSIWKRCVLAAIVTGAGIGALTYAGGPMAPSFKASLPDLIQSSSHQVSELLTATKSNVANFSGAAAAFAASKTGSFATMVKDLAVETVPQVVSAAAAASASKASLLTATIYESVQWSIHQVASVGLPPPGLATFAHNISASLKAAVAPATEAASSFAIQRTSDFLAQVPSISASASSWLLKASSALADLTQDVRPAVMQVPSFPTMILKLHAGVESIVDAVQECLSPRLASLAAATSDSESPMRTVSIQEALELAAKNITLGYCIWAALVLFIYAKPDLAVSAATTAASKASAAAAALRTKAEEFGNRLLQRSRPDSASSIPTHSTDSQPSRSCSLSKLKVLALLLLSVATMGLCWDRAFSPAQVSLPAAVQELTLLPVTPVSLDTEVFPPPHVTEVSHQNATVLVDSADASEPLPLPSSENSTASHFGPLDFIEELLRRYNPTPEPLMYPATGHQTPSHEIDVAPTMQFVERSSYVIQQSLPTSEGNESLPVLSVEPNHAATSQQGNAALASIEEPAEPAVTSIVRAKPVQYANKTQTPSLEDAWFAFIMSLDWRSPVLQVDETSLARPEEPAPPAVTMIKRAKPVPYANQSLITAPDEASSFPNTSLFHLQADEFSLPSMDVSALPVLPTFPVPKVNESQAATMPEPVLSVPSQDPQFLEPLITSEDSLRGPPSGRIEEVVAGPLLPHDLSIETSATVITKGLADLLELKCRLISHTARNGLDDEIVLHCTAKV